MLRTFVLFAVLLMIISMVIEVDARSFYEVLLEMTACILFIFILIRAEKFIARSRMLLLGMLLLILSHLLGVVTESQRVIMFFESIQINTLVIIDVVYLVGLLSVALGLNKVIKEYIMHSNYDELTGLNTRKRLSELSDDDADRVLVYIDLDDLKTVNDSDGHIAGDRLIQNFSSILKSIDLIEEKIRMGGDEFIVICASDNKQVVADQISAKAEKLNIGFSYGIADITEGDLENTIKCADNEMYRMKSSRKNKL